MTIDLEGMTIREADCILHASGLSQSKEQYRTHYCIHPDDPLLLKLVADGYFAGPSQPGFLGAEAAMFYLTVKGIEAAKRLASRFNSFRCNCIGKDEEE